MDTISDAFYLIYVIHQNAFITLYRFVITNIAIVLLVLAMLYVFNKRNELVEKETIRPLRRSTGISPTGPEQGQFGGLSEDIIMATLSKERIKLIALYLSILITSIICFLFATKVVLYMVTIMWIIGALSVKLLRGDREEMANKIENYSLGYCLILIMIKIMISLVVGTPISEWSRSLGVALPASAAGTLTGYLPMMFLIMTFGLPLAYFRVVAQRYSIAHNNEDVVKRRGEIMRTSNQNGLNQFQDDMYQNQNKWF